MDDHPFVEIHAPSRGFRDSDISRINRHTGVISVEGLDRREDESFAGLRVTFANDEVMQMYLDAWPKGK